MVIKEDALTKQKKTSTKNTKIIKRITTKCQTAKKKRAFGRRKTFLFNFIAYFHFFFALLLLEHPYKNIRIIYITIFAI